MPDPGQLGELREPAAARALRHVASRATGDPLDRTATVTLHLHPDRPGVLSGLRERGTYVSQFVTGTGNGGLTAYRGGDRWRWESRLFGGAYDDAAPEERPVYGSLDHARSPVGGSPRFGSGFFRLRPEVLVRTTFCWPDSVFEPTDLGVAQAMRLVRLLEDARDVDPLDRYVEAHVHGPVRLADDVDALVLDPSHRGTDFETVAATLGCRVEWHPGFRLGVEALREHADYRGPEAVALGERIAVDGVLTPRVLGEAVAQADPQHLKWLWHCLARFGGPGA